MTDDIIENCTIKIEDSQINSDMLRELTKYLVDNAWLDMLEEVDYASKAINLIERKQIYDANTLLVSKNDPILKPDHTACRGFVDSENSISGKLNNFNPLTATYEQLCAVFNGFSGTSFSVLILQMLGAKLSTNICNFPAMNAQGTHLYFENTGDIILDKTKHFVSSQDVSLLDPKYQELIRKIVSDSKLPINADEWSMIQRVYKGETLSDNELLFLRDNLARKIFSCTWQTDYKTAEKLCDGAKSKDKSLEYAFSTLMRGNRLNHGTWRVSDIYRALGILQELGTNPINVRGGGTYLEQTAGMASICGYKTKDGKIFEAPGAFLEVASRPYMLINEEGDPINKEGKTVDLDKKQPFLLHEVKIELDCKTWKDDKIFLTQDGDLLSLSDLNKGKIIKNSLLTNKDSIAYCYEGFKEANAEGIFFASGGIVI